MTVVEKKMILSMHRVEGQGIIETGKRCEGGYRMRLDKWMENERVDGDGIPNQHA